MITLVSSDGDTYEVEEAVAMQSETLKHLIEDICDDSAIPLPNIKGRILSKVIVYCKKHAESDNIREWDENFVEVDQGMLFDFIMAANYLNIKSLLDLTCGAVANMIKGKSPEEIREIFNIENDYTPEEKEEVRRDNQWAFE
ncbi:hypothetical protein L6164_031575 [Bauhinia variegata]|nr:hypothetical protein L6164_031575 [Bauhinia variegata]